MSRRPLIWTLCACALVAGLAACGRGTGRTIAGADRDRGKHLIGFYGCGTCHVIAGISTANGHVGPSLEGLENRRTIAGKLPNTTPSLERWIEDPQRYVPGNDMPDLGVTPAAAKDIAAYLYRQ